MSSRPTSLVVRTAWAAFFAALVAACIDACFVVAHAVEARSDVAATLLAITELGVFYLWPALLLGLPVGGVLLFLSRLPLLTDVAATLGEPRRWFRRDPTAAASAVALPLMLLGSFAAVARVSLYFFQNAHDPDLAALATAGVTVVVVSGLAVAFLMLRSLLGRVFRLLGLLANPGLVVVLEISTACVGAGYWLFHNEAWLRAIDPKQMAWLPSLALLFVLTLFFVNLRRRTTDHPYRRLVAVMVLTGGAFAFFAVTYDRSRNARSLVERSSVGGQRLVHLFGELTDLDRDGYAGVFGGGDCNDFNSAIHPDALDERGDGVDADCFDGDGAQTKFPLGDGGYAALDQSTPRPNILLVSIDTLRPNHLGSFGYKTPTSPRLDAFAKDATVFRQAFAPSSRTMRSVPAFLSGTYPSHVRYGDEVLWPSVRPENQLLAELLSAHGYQTTAVAASDYFARAHGLFQGFESNVVARDYRPAVNWAVDRGIAELRDLVGSADPRPWFLWVHLFNVHGAYLADKKQSRFAKTPVGAYDTEVYNADQQVGRLLDTLATFDPNKATIVAIVSDHGEALGERSHWGHSRTLYNEELLATFMLRAPGYQGSNVETPVSLIDLFPTLLNFARIPMPAPSPAQSVVPLMRPVGQPVVKGASSARSPRNIVAELMPDGVMTYDERAIVSDGYKLIWGTRDSSLELFDLVRDPREQNNLADRDPARVSTMLRYLRAWTSGAGSSGGYQRTIARNRLPRVPERISHRLGLIVDDTFEIIGYNSNGRRRHPGETITFTFFYRVLAETDHDWLFQILPEYPTGYRPIGQFHGTHYPLAGQYRTNEWRQGEILRDEVAVAIPTRMVPGKFKFNLSIVEDKKKASIAGRPTGIVPLVDVEIVPAPRGNAEQMDEGD